MAELSKISDILCNLALDEKNCSNSVKKATAFGFWKDICGSKFANFSIPYDIKGSTLVVAVKSPQVMQELIFNKTVILKKLENYFLPLNIKINDIKYDYKIWNRANSSIQLIGDETLTPFSKNEIENISLDIHENAELKKVTDTISNMAFLNNEQKNKYMENIINSIKAKKIQGV